MSLRGDAIWNATSAVIGRVAGVLFWIVVARLVTAGELGELISVQATALTAVMIVSGGLASASSQFVAQVVAARDRSAYVTVVAAMSVGAVTSVVLGAGIYVGAEGLAGLVLKRPELRETLELASLFGGAVGLASAATGVLSGLHGFRAIAVMSLVANVAQLLVAPTAIRMFGFSGAILALSVGQIIVAVGAVAAIEGRLRGMRPLEVSMARGRISSTLGTLASRALWATTAHGSFQLASWIGIALLVRQSDGLEEAALFGVGTQWRQITLFLPTILMQVSLPAFSRVAVRDDSGKLRGQLQEFSGVMVKYLLLMTVGLIALGPILLGLYGDSYVSGWGTFAVLQVTALIQGLQAYRITELQGNGRFGAVLAVNIPTSLTLVIAAWYLVPAGSVGLSVAYALSFGVAEVTLRLLTSVSKNQKDVV